MMRLLKSNAIRRCRRLLLLVLLVWVLVWCIASLAARAVVAGMVPRIQEKAKRSGVVMGEVHYRTVRVSPWLNGISIRELSLDFDLKPTDRHVLPSSFECETLQLTLTDLFAMKGRIAMEDFEVNFHSSDRPERMPFDRFDDGQLVLGDVPFLAPRQAFHDLLANVKDLFDDNIATGAFEFGGVVQIKLGGSTYPARMFTERDGEAFRLRFSKEDIRALSQRMGLGLAEEQVKVVSLYPLRVPLIASLTVKAKQISVSFHHGDEWKQDALRHLSWSYMLTQTFGAEFAKLVTDAQESKPGNTHDERLMDYNNNAVGRAWVAEKVKIQQIPRMMLEDRRVVLSPEDARSRGEANLLR
ncbi:hypothetical protein HW115_07525 [Verrucomicrobiaceae bacterium N1E253]|uniref:DUF6973 domain-containing protein n=1 Tax=Oceaniferula marina TaxID=2748318 RepID=A0A851GDG2_9BACT|nr:hypothetical protein [Oceaniferula marina]NWK55456.1 hypothetical protein [Oceaniferula marina]